MAMALQNTFLKKQWNYIDDFIVTDYSNVSGSADKLYAVIENPEQIDIIISILPKELYLHLSRDNLAMMMHKEATKYNAILVIVNEFGIFEEEIIAFGDDINDKEMLLNVGLGIAMGNSVDEMKMIAEVRFCN
ncbi:MAG TPA: HAD hydrolase family protein [Clostridiales bacterium]|nr:HAD hydrolase family protein [Clostridiales bacterium]